MRYTRSRISSSRVGYILRDLFGMTAFIALMFVFLAPLVVFP